jgi:hypothetical protein
MENSHFFWKVGNFTITRLARPRELIQYHYPYSDHNYPLSICESFSFYPLSENHTSRTRHDENLNTAQRHQSWTREVFRQLNANTYESPLRRRTPVTRPETPTPQPGAVERARMNTRQSNRETRNDDLQDSPRRRHPRNTQDENHALSPPERKEISRRVSLRNRVRISIILCDRSKALFYLCRSPSLQVLFFRVIYYYQALLLRKSLAPVIKLSHHGSRCNSLKVKDLWVSNVGINRPTFNVIEPCRPTKVSIIPSFNCARN